MTFIYKPGKLASIADAIRNTKFLLHIWDTRVPVNSVDLDQWHGCGGVACLGGHLVMQPEFRALPGATSFHGAPSLGPLAGALPETVLFRSRFGGAALFAPAPGANIDPVEQWAIARGRILDHINYLEKHL